MHIFLQIHKFVDNFLFPQLAPPCSRTPGRRRKTVNLVSAWATCRAPFCKRQNTQKNAQKVKVDRWLRNFDFITTINYFVPS